MFLSSTRVPSLALADGPDADVGVAAEAALFEVAVVDADEDKNVPQGPQVLGGFGGAAQIGIADNLDERHPRTVQVDDRDAAGVNVLARILLHVNARDSDPLRLPVDLDVEMAAVR